MWDGGGREGNKGAEDVRGLRREKREREEKMLGLKWIGGMNLRQIWK